MISTDSRSAASGDARLLSPDSRRISPAGDPRMSSLRGATRSVSPADARRVCYRYGEVPTYETNGDIQVCVWTLPPCRGRDVICRSNRRGSLNICCKKKLIVLSINIQSGMPERILFNYVTI